MNPLLPLVVCLCQAPQQDPPPAPPARLDVVELKNGDELIGRVTAELDDYVEVEVEKGATIGVSRAMVVAIRRGAAPAPTIGHSLRPDDAWFVLHDAAGTSVGWLHSAITAAPDGTFTISEEYEFVDGVRRYQVTNLCTAGADGGPRTSYFRERVSEPTLPVLDLPNVSSMAAAARVVDERIVEATANGARLTVRHVDGDGRWERELPWSTESTFPLLARTLARQASVAIGPVTMFDSACEELVERRVDGTGVRQVMLDGERVRVAEVVEVSAAGRNSEWIDANHVTVRRELAGPALVAVPSSQASARAAVGATQIDSALVGEAGGRFGLWVPNPAWRVPEELPAGHIALICPVHDAEIRLSRLDHLDEGTVLDTAADAVARWFVLLHPGLSIDGRQAHEVRGRDAVRVFASSQGRNRAQRATIDVVPHGGAFLVLICRAPASAWDELERDFAFVARTIELEAEALAPTMQGPLVEREKRSRPAGGAAAGTPPPAARAEAKVRIP